MNRDVLRSCLAAALIAISYVASAQTPARGAPVATEAQDEFTHGERAFAEGDYARALRHFQNADRLAPHGAVRFNVAICLDKLGRIREALELYHKLSESSELDEAARAEAAERGRQAAAALATLEITGPGGTLILVDDRDRCRAPCSLKLDPGEHVVRTDGSSDSRRVRLSSGEKLRVELPGSAKSAAAAPQIAESPANSGTKPTQRDRFGTLSYIGGSVAILGFSGFAYYGIRTENLHQEYRDKPDPDTRDRGIRARTTANIALGVALVGTALVIVDWATSSSGTESVRAPGRSPRTLRAQPFVAVLAPE
jgi:hypothetical protein